MFDNHALFIGVDDYSTYDRSTGREEGTSNLLGSRNDAALFWRVYRQLGVPASNMRILTSPRLDPSLLDGATEENVGEATAKDILAGAAWLADRLAGPSRPAGFLTFSGHGDFLEGEGLVLCPSDVVGQDLENAILLARLQAVFASARAAANLTVLLDCCHSATRAPKATRRRASLTGRSLPAVLASDVALVGDRVLSACEPRQSSWQARFSGVYRGAFSWAVGAVMEQWQARASHGGVELDLSYGELIERAGRLLDALSFDQTPTLRGRPGVADLPVFHAGPAAGPEPTAAEPNAAWRGGQLDPDCRYRIVVNEYTGEVLSTGETVGPAYVSTYNPNAEYWSLTPGLVRLITDPTTGARLSLTQTTLEWSASLGFPTEGAYDTFAMPNFTVWTRMSSPPRAAFFAPGSYTGIQFHLSATGERVQGTITWYLGVSSSAEYLAGYGVDAESRGTTFTYGDAPALPREYAWYTVSLTPLTWMSTTQVDVAGRVFGAGATFSSTTANARLSNMLWLAYTASSGDVLLLSTTDGTDYAPSRSSPTRTGASARSAPALAIVDASSTGTLYLAYRASSGDDIQICWSTDGATFSSPLDTTLDSSHAPALASLSGKLFMAYRDASADDALYVVQPDDPQRGWSSATPHLVARDVSGDPSMVAFNGQLYLAIRGSSGTVDVYQSRDRVTWTQTASILEDLRDPSIAVYGGFLYIAYRDADSNVWICSSPDGTTWSGFSDLTSQIAAVTTLVAPTLCPASATALVLGWVDTSSGSELWTVTAT